MGVYWIVLSGIDIPSGLVAPTCLNGCNIQLIRILLNKVSTLEATNTVEFRFMSSELDIYSIYSFVIFDPLCDQMVTLNLVVHTLYFYIYKKPMILFADIVSYTWHCSKAMVTLNSDILKPISSILKTYGTHQFMKHYFLYEKLMELTNFMLTYFSMYSQVTRWYTLHGIFIRCKQHTGPWTTLRL